MTVTPAWKVPATKGVPFNSPVIDGSTVIENTAASTEIPFCAAVFGAERVRETGPAPASEDFGSFGTEWHVPSVFWFVGGTDPETYAKAKAANKLNELPVNHSPKFAPVLHPTLQTGVETLVVATRAWLPA